MAPSTLDRSSVLIGPVASKEDWKAFLDLPEGIYADDPHWVAPLKTEVQELLSDANPFWRHAERAVFLARREDGTPVGRIAAVWDRLFVETQGQKTGLFGFFECVNDPAAAAALLEAAAKWLVSKGAARMMGPFSPSINDECGLLVEGFGGDPYIMEPHNPPYYKTLLEACGFSKAKDLYAWCMDDVWKEPERIKRLAERVRRKPGLKLRTIDMRRFKEELQLIREVFNASWADNWGFTPITPEEIAFTAKKLKPILKPEIIHFIELDGKTAGISIGLPDVNQALKPLRGKMGALGLLKLLWGLRKIDQGRLLVLGIKKEFRNKGLELLLYYEIILAGRKLGWKRGEGGWTLEDNQGINEGIRAAGGRIYKTYRIYARDLAA